MAIDTLSIIGVISVVLVITVLSILCKVRGCNNPIK